jgi:hypothetical protein
MCFYFHLAIIVFVKEYRKGQLLYHSCSRHIPTLETCKTPLLFPLKFYLPFKCFVGIFSRTFFSTQEICIFIDLAKKKFALFRERKNLFFLRVSIQNANFSPHSEWVRISIPTFIFIYLQIKHSCRNGCFCDGAAKRVFS